MYVAIVGDNKADALDRLDNWTKTIKLPETHPQVATAAAQVVANLVDMLKDDPAKDVSVQMDCTCVSRVVDGGVQHNAAIGVVVTQLDKPAGLQKEGVFDPNAPAPAPVAAAQ